MNKIYKIVKNKSGASQVAGELAKGAKKGMLLAAIGAGMLSFGAQAEEESIKKFEEGSVGKFIYYGSGGYGSSVPEYSNVTYFLNQEHFDSLAEQAEKYKRSISSITGIYFSGRSKTEKTSNIKLTVDNVSAPKVVMQTVLSSNQNYASSLDANDILLEINDSTVDQAIAVNYNMGVYLTQSIKVERATTIVTNSAVANAVGAFAAIQKSYNDLEVKTELNYNSLIFNNSETTSGAYISSAAYAYIETAGDNFESVTAHHNSVEINDSHLNNLVAGAIFHGTNNNNKEVTLTENTVSINGNSSVNSIYGAMTFNKFASTENYDIVTGNTFNFNNLEKGTKEITVAEMGNFENYNVYLQESGEQYFKNNGDKENALITVTSKFGNQLSANQNPDLAKANLWIENQAFTKEEMQNVKPEQKFYILSMGDEIKYATEEKDASKTSLKDNLVINPNNNGREGLKLGENTFAVGTIYSLETELKMDDNSVYLEIAGVTENEGDPDPNVPNMIIPALPVDENAIDRNSPVLDSKIAALSILNSGNDLNHDILIGIEPTQQGEIISFGKLAGEHNKAKGTSDIHINGVNAILGTGVSLSDKTVIGGYFEYGYGHYDSTRDFDGYKLGSLDIDAMHYKGKGNANYQGLGALIKSYANDYLYFNGGLKIGNINWNYSSTSFTDYEYRVANMDYSTSKLYFGAQVGTGFKLQLTDNSQLNSSINFIYSQFGANSFELDDSHIRLNKIKSERLVFNEEYKYYFNEDLGLKLSGAFDYEFRSIAEGTIDDHTMTNSSLRGGTVIFGAGILLTPFEDRNNQYFDLSVNASAGKNQSVGGSLTFNYKF